MGELHPEAARRAVADDGPGHSLVIAHALRRVADGTADRPVAGVEREIRRVTRLVLRRFRIRLLGDHCAGSTRPRRGSVRVLASLPGPFPRATRYKPAQCQSHALLSLLGAAVPVCGVVCATPRSGDLKNSLGASLGGARAPPSASRPAIGSTREGVGLTRAIAFSPAHVRADTSAP